MLPFQLDNKLGKALSLAILFISVALFSFTGNYIALTLPFIYLFVLLVGANWKTAYWILLFTIPFSFLIYFRAAFYYITG